MPHFYMILAGKIIKIPEFYTIFVRKKPNFYIIIARKYFFPDFFFGGEREGGARTSPPPPSSYAYASWVWGGNRIWHILSVKEQHFCWKYYPIFAWRLIMMLMT